VIKTRSFKKNVDIIHYAKVDEGSSF